MWTVCGGMRGNRDKRTALWGVAKIMQFLNIFLWKRLVSRCCSQGGGKADLSADGYQNSNWRQMGYSGWMFRIGWFYCFTLLIALGGCVADAQTSATPAEEVLQREMPGLASQFQLSLRPPGNEGDTFRISGTAGHIRVEAGTLPTLLYGVNWYLKYVAHLQVSTNGMQLGHAGMLLPAPQKPIEKPALYKWRYALNENADGYSAPYWSEARWRHEIDVLALSGTNAVLIERGADLVLYQTFRDAGYSDAAIRQWITQPAHQNWQLMGNMCCFIEPISMELLQ